MTTKEKLQLTDWQKKKMKDFLDALGELQDAGVAMVETNEGVYAFNTKNIKEWYIPIDPFPEKDENDIYLDERENGFYELPCFLTDTAFSWGKIN